MKHSLLLGACLLSLFCLTQAVSVRFVNACPDCGTLDPYLDSRPLHTQVGYGEVTKNKFAVPGNGKNFMVRDTKTKAQLMKFKVDLNLEHPISICAINFKGKLNYYIVQDYDIGSGVEFFRGAVKAVNLCSNCPTLEGVRGHNHDDIVWPQLTYTARSWYRDIPDGNQTFFIRAVGDQTVLHAESVSIQELQVYTMFIFGDYSQNLIKSKITTRDFIGMEVEADGQLVPYKNEQLQVNDPPIQASLYGYPF